MAAVEEPVVGAKAKAKLPKSTGKGSRRSVREVNEVALASDASSSLEQQMQAKVEQAGGFIAMVQEFVDGEQFTEAKLYEVKTQVEILEMGFKELRELGRGAEYVYIYMHLKNKLNMKNQEAEQQGAFSGNITVQSKVDLEISRHGKNLRRRLGSMFMTRRYRMRRS